MDIKKIGSGVLAASAIAVGTALPAQAAETVKVGVLSCEAVEGTRLNLLVRSTVDVRCTFEGGGVKEAYRGETGIELGLDLSFRKNEKFAFSVLSTSSDDVKGHSLSGKYIGASASATAGVGLGAATLIGGSNDNFGLQPLAISTNQGFGIAGGIGFLYIEAAK